MRHVAGLFSWLLAATVGDSATAAAISSAPDRADVVEALAREQLGPFIQIKLGRERVLSVDLQGRSVAGTAIAALLTQLALEDVDTDLVLLRAIRVENGHAADRLLLQDLGVPFALSFSRITFEAGLTFDNVNFAREVDFDQITSQGKLFIDRSSFRQGLSIGGGSALARSGDDTALHVNKTKIERDLLISGLRSADDVEFYDNRIEPALRVEDAEFHAKVIIRDNSLADLLIYNTRFADFLSIYSNEIDRLELKANTNVSKLEISQNRIQNMTDVSDVFLSGSYVEFAFNELERELYFAPKTIASDIGEIALVGNTVQGLATVIIPQSRLNTPSSHWWQPLRLDASSSTFAGLLRIESERFVNEVPLTAPDEDPLTPPGDYCYRDFRQSPVLSINLTAVEAARFRWALPLGDCRVVWNGSGFRYRQWVADGADDHRVDDLLEWRRQISGPQPSALLYMSEHLRGQGRFTDSRNIIFEAKRMDYEPSQSCALSWNIVSVDTCAVQDLRYGFLYASGFGVKPEYALYFLGLIWLAGVMVYYPYVWIMRKKKPAYRPIVVVPKWLDTALDWLYRKLCWAGWAQLRPRRPGADLIGSARGGNPPGMRPPEGFKLYQGEQEPKKLSLWVFSLDAALPVVNLHAYDAYFPEASLVRAFSFLQHGFGWWIATSLLASLALL